MERADHRHMGNMVLQANIFICASTKILALEFSNGPYRIQIEIALRSSVGMGLV